MLVKICFFVVAIVLPPLGLVAQNRKIPLSIVSLLLWISAVYCFFEISVIIGLILHLTLAFFSILNLIMNASNIQTIHFDKESGFTVLATSFILISLIYLFNFRINVESISVVKSERIINGKQLFSNKCSACHYLTKDNFVGPHLANIYGRKAGTVDNYEYSKNMAKADFVWSDEQLLKYLTNQNELIQGTRMIISPIPKQDIFDIIEYLKNNYN
ncbi:MAG: cytochrome c [Psychroserpens sp.]|jgi:cytochrome c